VEGAVEGGVEGAVEGLTLRGAARPDPGGGGGGRGRGKPLPEGEEGGWKNKLVKPLKP